MSTVRTGPVPDGRNEPILTLDGDRILDRKGRVYEGDLGRGVAHPGQHTCCWVTCRPSFAQEGRDLQIMYQNELVPREGSPVGSDLCSDPDDRRMKS